ncbi:hypothetical protein KSP40_PGU012721 [Platanthera guangdongensis]|uniref:Uncharacterized protein n=1 Tax=Platanthera guangdongensis TaxID=2320717 RepID=A0ABR2MP51_9ASPA
MPAVKGDEEDIARRKEMAKRSLKCQNFRTTTYIDEFGGFTYSPCFADPSSPRFQEESDDSGGEAGGWKEGEDWSEVMKAKEGFFGSGTVIRQQELRPGLLRNKFEPHYRLVIVDIARNISSLIHRRVSLSGYVSFDPNSAGELLRAERHLQAELCLMAGAPHGELKGGPATATIIEDEGKPRKIVCA